METDFWLQRWQDKQIGFHESNTNPSLLKHFNALSLEKGSRVLIPLCGKTLDIAWLLSQDYKVAGAELSELAITELFEELNITPHKEVKGTLTQYTAEDIDIFVGDIFDLSRDLLGPIDAIYDRAALVALPEEMRIRYSKHLIQLSDTAPQLLISYEYDQSLMEGPPFSITAEEVLQRYSDSYQIQKLDSIELPEDLKGKCDATESVWLLQSKCSVHP